MKIPDILRDAVIRLAENYILVVISSTMSDSIKQILAREGIESYFPDVLGTDVDKSKVVKINNIIDKYKTSSEHCIFVTDTLGDIREADHCSVKSVAVTWGFQTVDSLKKGNPIAIVDDPSDLARTIEDVLK